jgi:hypothetical protein
MDTKKEKSSPSRCLNPPPDEIDIETGKMMWVIKEEYKIWASSYEEALNILSLIENE